MVASLGLQMLLLFLGSQEHAIRALTLDSASSSFVRTNGFFGEQVRRRSEADSCGHVCSLYMRKQKASDRRTRRAQRGEVAVAIQDVSSPSLSLSSTLTQSPMERVGQWKLKEVSTTSTSPPPATRRRQGGRGRSRKRSTLYNSISFYHDKFLDLLTAEYRAEV